MKGVYVICEWYTRGCYMLRKAHSGTFPGTGMYTHIQKCEDNGYSIHNSDITGVYRNWILFKINVKYLIRVYT